MSYDAYKLASPPENEPDICPGCKAEGDDDCICPVESICYWCAQEICVCDVEGVPV